MSQKKDGWVQDGSLPTNGMMELEYERKGYKVLRCVCWVWDGFQVFQAAFSRSTKNNGEWYTGYFNVPEHVEVKAWCLVPPPPKPPKPPKPKGES